MLSFYVGAVRQEVTSVLQQNVARCLHCDSTQVSFVKYDNVLQLLSFSVWRSPGCYPALRCESCGFMLPTGKWQAIDDGIFKKWAGPADERQEEASHGEGEEGEEEETQSGQPRRCWSCANELTESTFKYCTECGSRQERFWR